MAQRVNARARLTAALAERAVTLADIPDLLAETSGYARIPAAALVKAVPHLDKPEAEQLVRLFRLRTPNPATGRMTQIPASAVPAADWKALDYLAGAGGAAVTPWQGWPFWAE